jgi:putative DNA primase/helicase
LDWQQNGLPMAQVVEDATNEYRQSEDTLGQFIEENCIVGEHYQVPAQLLYDTYAEWARRSNIYVNSLQKFGRQLTDRGFITRPSGTGGKKVRFGIGLLQ